MNLKRLNDYRLLHEELSAILLYLVKQDRARRNLDDCKQGVTVAIDDIELEYDDIRAGVAVYENDSYTHAYYQTFRIDQVCDPEIIIDILVAK